MNLFDHASRYPDHPGYRRTDTSLGAARAMASSAGRLRRIALDAIRTAGHRGLTSYELAELTGHDHASMQPRTSELRLSGEIIASSQRRSNPRSGRSTIVWIAREIAT